MGSSSEKMSMHYLERLSRLYMCFFDVALSNDGLHHHDIIIFTSFAGDYGVKKIIVTYESMEQAQR